MHTAQRASQTHIDERLDYLVIINIVFIFFFFLNSPAQNELMQMNNRQIILFAYQIMKQAYFRTHRHTYAVSNS